MNHFSIGLWHATESGFYTTTGDDQFSGWTKKKLQSTSQGQIYTKKRSQSLFGGLLPIWSTIAFWILTKPLQLRSMLSKSVRWTRRCSTRSQHWWKGLVLLLDSTQLHITQPALQKLNKSGKIFCPILGIHLTSHQPTATLPSVLTTFCRENASTKSKR